MGSQHQFIMAIEIFSKVLTAAEITASLGKEPTLFWDRGDVDFRGRRQSHSKWRLDSGRPYDAPLESHLRRLFSLWPKGGTARLRKLDFRSAALIRVAAIYKTYTCTVSLSPKWVQRIAAEGLELQVSSLPGGSNRSHARISAWLRESGLALEHGRRASKRRPKLGK